MNAAERALFAETSRFLAEHYQGPGVDALCGRIDRALADDLDGRFARLRAREAAAACPDMRDRLLGEASDLIEVHAPMRPDVFDLLQRIDAAITDDAREG